MKSLDPIFKPNSIAVIGASRNRGTIGAEIFHNLISNHFQGSVFPVNPNTQSVQGVFCYSSVSQIPISVDLAIIVVPAKHVLKIAKECADVGVKALVVISAGFRETGQEGQVRERELVDLCRSHNIRLVGPNCLGVLSANPRVSMDATFAPTFPPAGNVAFSSQSGAMGLAILDYAKQLGIGISNFVSVGNKADVSGNDLIEYWRDDPDTDVILLYLESFGNPKKFLNLAREVCLEKPIVAVKSGRSQAGSLAASSHTGALATPDAAVDALFRQSGVIRVNSVEELFDMSMILANQPLPAGKGVAILTNAGGPAIMAADACEKWGLSTPELSKDTQEKLREFLPKEASFRNPVDMIASASQETFSKAIPILLDDPSVDSLFIIYVPPIVTKPKEIAQAIVDASKKTSKTIVACFMGIHGVPQGLRSLQKGNIPSYTFPEAAVASLARAYEHSKWRTEEGQHRAPAVHFDFPSLEKYFSKPGWLSQVDAFSVLKLIGIQVAEPKLARFENIAKQADEVGYPCVLKIVSDKILHKTELGGVALDLKNQAEVLEAASRMLDRAHQAGIDKKDVDGFVIQKMIPAGQEVVMGCKREGAFGHVLMFGLGGIQVEVLKDVQFAISPLRLQDADWMIKNIRSFPLLNGFRGQKKCDTESLQNILLRLSQLVQQYPVIEEFDINPVRVFEHGAVVVDVRIRVGKN